MALGDSIITSWEGAGPGSCASFTVTESHLWDRQWWLRWRRIAAEEGEKESLDHVGSLEVAFIIYNNL